MGDAFSRAAEAAESRWLASPEYKVRHALCSRQNATRYKAKKILVGNLCVEDLQFLIIIPEYIDPRGEVKIYKSDVERLEKLVNDHI